MTADEIIIAVQEALERCKAPVIYIHNAEEEPFAAVVSIEWINQNTREIGDLFDDHPLLNTTHHSHIEPGMF